MASRDYEMIAFTRLSEVAPEVIIELVNDPAVRRHLPLARGHFGPSECEKFVADKERIWEEHGYGPGHSSSMTNSSGGVGYNRRATMWMPGWCCARVIGERAGSCIGGLLPMPSVNSALIR